MFWKKDPKKAKYEKAHKELPGIRERASARKEEEKKAKAEERSSFGRAADALSDAAGKLAGKAKAGAQDLRSAATDKVEEMKARVDALRADKEKWAEELKKSNETITQFYKDVSVQVIPITEENKNDAIVLAFNQSLNKILEDIKKNIVEGVGLMNELTELNLQDKVAYSEALAEFHIRQKHFIENSRAQIEVSKQQLKDDTIRELYNTLKENLNDPMWKKHAVVGVPTGVKEMIDVLNGTENQKWYYRMRHKTQNVKPIDTTEMLFRIQKMHEIAVLRLSQSSRRAEPTKNLYESLKSVDIPTKTTDKIDTSDLQKMNKCIKDVHAIKGQDVVADFTSQKKPPGPVK